MTLSRRTMLLGALASSGLVISGCTTTRVQNTTTYTLDVSKLKVYATATLTAIGVITTTIEPIETLKVFKGGLDSIKVILQDALDLVNTHLDDTLSFTYDATNGNTIVDSLFSALDKTLFVINTIVYSRKELATDETKAIFDTITQYRDAIAVLVMVVATMIQNRVPLVPVELTHNLSENQALYVLTRV